MVTKTHHMKYNKNSITYLNTLAMGLLWLQHYIYYIKEYIKNLPEALDVAIAMVTIICYNMYSKSMSNIPDTLDTNVAMVKKTYQDTILISYTYLNHLTLWLL